MGGDKPLRRLNGRSLLDRALDLAEEQGGQDVAVAVRTKNQVGARADCRLLLDPPDVAGPLAGLQSALAFAIARRAPFVLTMPCDAPYLPRDLGVRLRADLAEGHGVAMARSLGRLHPTCALWRADAAAALPAYRDAGGASLKGFAAAIGLTIVDWDTASDPFVNLNTPEDLTAAAEVCA